ncbi:olfactory receptor 14A16-like [Varanus komodoensis]|uniref:olfactory receptor 14A16-like n=1 Tax=Varanus komodoensis TaxID=61221 RepID=UPI001CF7B77E|nr:olfactory receptor 14A16-like [Varanus komodoensis]
MNNLTFTTTFILLEFSNIQDLLILYFCVFLALYLITMIGNLLIIIIVSLDHKLHTPMYFFLMNLAILDMGTVSVMVPKSMAMFLVKKRTISYFECVAQVFFFLFFAATDFSVLIIMAHDRCIAICNPLQYERIMHKGACLQMVTIGWSIGLLYAILHTGGTFANTFCSNIVHQFFCEVPQLIKLSCSDIYLVEVGLIVLSSSTVVASCVFIIITYMQIFAAVLKIPSVHGKRKALSTCLPHLIVVSVFVFSAVFAYARPLTNVSSDLDIAFAVIYAMIPPMLNPFIYSMRNKEIKAALSKIF